MHYRACCNQADVDALGKFKFTGYLAKMTLYGVGTYHRDTRIELVPKTYDFDRFDQNIEIVQQGNGKLINFFCGLKFAGSAGFAAATTVMHL